MTDTTPASRTNPAQEHESEIPLAAINATGPQPPHAPPRTWTLLNPANLWHVSPSLALSFKAQRPEALGLVEVELLTNGEGAAPVRRARVVGTFEEADAPFAICRAGHTVTICRAGHTVTICRAGHTARSGGRGGTGRRVGGVVGVAGGPQRRIALTWREEL